MAPVDAAELQGFEAHQPLADAPPVQAAEVESGSKLVFLWEKPYKTRVKTGEEKWQSSTVRTQILA